MPTVPADADVLSLLLPRPTCLRPRAGRFVWPPRCPVTVRGALAPPESAALERLGDRCRALLGVELRRTTAEPTGPCLIIESAGRHADAQPGADFAAAPGTQGYRLEVATDRVRLRAETAVGVLYGLQTVEQLLLLAGRTWPTVEIEDEPAYVVRGLSYDVSRGRVPTLAWLRRVVDRLAALKVNHLQLYVEHAFAFAFNPNIARGCSPLTPDEIRELEAHCRLRRIALVPSLASCGHMGRILSLPEYRHLAEVEATRPWEDAGWTERMRGRTLDVRNPEARRLLEQMYAEYLPLHGAPLMNVCCDETYDLGRGKNAAWAAEHGTGALFLEHLRFLHGLCARYGKRMLVWGDILKHHADVLAELPRDVVVLNWGYAVDADYESTALFRDAGLTTCVCPGTWSWNRVLNEINSAELNIRRHAAAGRQYGATGLLNTDWGDEGHINVPAGSWHPIALGAALAWNPSGPQPAEFDAAFGRLFLNDTTGTLVPALRAVAGAGAFPRNWPEFCRPLTESVGEDVVSTEQLRAWRAAALAGMTALGAAAKAAHAGADAGGAVGVLTSKPEAAGDLAELALACRVNALFAERLELARRLAAAGAADAALRTRLTALADECEAVVAPYEQAWHVRAKPSCVHEISAVFRRIATEARAAARAPAAGPSRESR